MSRALAMNVGRIRFPIRVGKGQPGSGIRFGFRWPVGPLARRRPTRTLRRPTRPFVFSDPRASRWPTRGCVGRPGLLRFPIRGCVGRPAFPDTTVGPLVAVKCVHPMCPLACIQTVVVLRRKFDFDLTGSDFNKCNEMFLHLSCPSVLLGVGASIFNCGWQQHSDTRCSRRFSPFAPGILVFMFCATCQ